MLKLIRRLGIKEYIFIILSIILIAFQVYLELKIPDYMTKITTLVQTSGSSIGDILGEGAKMLLCAFASLLSAVVVGYFTSYVSAVFSKKVRGEIFDKVEEYGMEEIKNFSTSSLITRTTNDVTQIEMFLAMGIQLLFRAPIMAIWALYKIIGKSAKWSILTAGGVLILLSFVILLMIVVVPKFKKIQKLIDKLNDVTRENLTGIRVIRAFNAEKYQEDRFEDANEKLTSIQLFTQKCFALMTPLMTFVMQFMALGTYFLGAIIISGAGLLDKVELFSNMVVFSSYSIQVIMSFLMLAIIFMILPRAQVSANRINEVLETEPNIKDGKEEHGKEGMVGTIEFNGVSFKYPDSEEYLIEDITFKVNKGETVALIGSTGAGKTTLINLIPRFYDATDGEILVDGVNVKDYKLNVLHNKLGYVSQKAFMFDGTVKDNISYGESLTDIDDDKIKKAIEVAQANDFVLKMDKEYESHIARGGTNISGGQKQRLSIARAIARNPEIYIFDDSFSALDYKTDSTLRKELKKYAKDATFVIVAQRIGTILNADKIIVLDKGKCVGMGTHKELLDSCEVYKEIAYSQLSKEELENA
jgi:ATP-binding cassette subfamily B protein